MASPRSYSHTEAERMEQIITEFFAKSLHIILESRSPSASRNVSGDQKQSSPSLSMSSSSSFRPRDKWFNLALKEYPASLENLYLGRQSNSEPVVVDVILAKKPLDSDSKFSPKREPSRNLSGKTRFPLCLSYDQYDANRTDRVIERWIVQYESKTIDAASCSRRTSHTLTSCYKKLMLLQRSLYVSLRLLPAYKIIHGFNLSGILPGFTLAHKLSTFVEPFTRKQEAEMEQFLFSPVETSCGNLRLSVIYRTSLSDLNFVLSAPMSPTFIPDYVGSPLANPLKRLPTFPVTHGYPSSDLSRRHSWSLDRYRVSPPSPTHSEPHSLVANPNLHRFPTVNLPPLEASGVYKKNRSLDDYSHSPICTSSGSSSPSLYIPGSAPVDIPISKLYNRRDFPNRLSLPPSSSSPTSKPGIMDTKKAHHPTEEGVKKFSLLKLQANLSQRNLPSKNYDKSSLEDFDDTDFSCPFDVDDIRAESFDKNFPAKSRDAAVGALVQMLKKAAPLQQEAFRSSFINNPDRLCCLDKAKTFADGLEELKGYKEMIKQWQFGVEDDQSHESKH